jgi:hypothetical protein
MTLIPVSKVVATYDEPKGVDPTAGSAHTAHTIAASKGEVTKASEQLRQQQIQKNMMDMSGLYYAEMRASNHNSYREFPSSP